MKNKYKRFTVLNQSIYGIYDLYNNHTSMYEEQQERMLTSNLPKQQAEEFLNRLVVDLNQLYIDN